MGLDGPPSRQVHEASPARWRSRSWRNRPLEVFDLDTGATAAALVLLDGLPLSIASCTVAQNAAGAKKVRLTRRALARVDIAWQARYTPRGNRVPSCDAVPCLLWR